MPRLSLVVLLAITTGIFPQLSQAQSPAADVAPDVAAKSADKPTAESDKSAKARSVEVVFVLDTTGSMSGMINAAKEKIWAIANTLATAKPAPTIRMGLVGYRDRGDDYVTKITDLTDDLDSVYEQLMGYKAKGGGDGPESVNQALAEAIGKIKWSTDESTYRVVFLVGDAPPHMDYKGEEQYPDSCKKSVRQDIIINTIQCGADGNTMTVWQKIAKLSEGQYFRVEQSGGAILQATPFDKDLAKLSEKLGGTRVYFGAKPQRLAAEAKSERVDKAVEASSDSIKARRVEFFSKAGGKAAFSGRDELVSGVTDGKVKLSEVKEEELPEALQKMTPAERETHIKKLAAERKKLQKEIEELSKKRQAHIKAEIAKQAKNGKKNSLDEAIFKSIQTQAAEKGLRYENVQY